MNQDLRNVIDAITSECSYRMKEINDNSEYFSDDWDWTICQSFLYIKNLLLKYAAKYDEEIRRQNSTQENPWDNGSDTWASKMNK